MRIDDLIWTERNIEHISYHGVDPDEIEDVIWDNEPWFERRRGKKQRYIVYGQGLGGRYLFIVLDQERDALFYVVTARDMTKRERQYYQVRRK